MPGTEQSGNVLVVDDDPAVGKVLVALLAQAGIGCHHVLDASSAMSFLREQPVDVVVSDLRMPGRSGVELLEDVVERWPETPVILLTAHPTVEVAVEAMRKGAADFLCKPFDREEILFTVRKQIAAARHNDRPPVAEIKGGAMASSSPKMREVEDMIRRAAAGHFTVLIRGENGTGKDVTARAIHQSGPRRDGPFVRVQCAAFPEGLIESELFGYEKGAFNGAATRRPGRVDAAQGGTLFLDEIGDVQPSVQVKLLRLLQEREYERLGSNQTLKSTARFIAATHQPLEELIRKGKFREDLFFRLNVVPIWVPPLRERVEDIAPLTLLFCKAAAASNGRGPIAISPQALELLAHEPWPGNVRQLQNFVERLVIMSDVDRLTVADVERELARQPTLSLFADDRPSVMGPAPEATAMATPRSPFPMDHPSGGQEQRSGPVSLEASRREAEKQAILAALALASGNKVKAALTLGISRRTLYNKLTEHGLL
jgi:two-component system response regulator AtoC